MFTSQRSHALDQPLHPVQRLAIPLLFAALLIGPAPLASALPEEPPAPAPLVAPPGPTSHFPTRFDVLDAPAHFTQVLQVVDFASGAWTPPHTPGGYVYTTVIEGEISTRMVGIPGRDDIPAQEAAYPAGSTFLETPGEYMQVGNAGVASARVIATTLLPVRAPLTIYQDGRTSNTYPSLTDWYATQDIVVGAPGPMTADRSSIDVDRPTGAFELVQLMLDFNPGVSTPQHMHGGQELAMVTTGEMTLQRGRGVEVFAAGESWVNTFGLVHAASNDGADFAQVVATFLLPAGRPLTTAV